MNFWKSVITKSVKIGENRKKMETMREPKEIQSLNMFLTSLRMMMMTIIIIVIMATGTIVIG